MSFSARNWTPPPANPFISYVIFHRKPHSSTSWCSNKLSYFPKEIQLLVKLIFRKTMLIFSKNPTSPPCDFAKIYVIFHKNSNSSCSWSSNKLCYLLQNIQLLLHLIIQWTMLFSTRKPTPPPINPLINCVVFHRKSDSSSSWYFKKLSYFPNKNPTPPPAETPRNYVFFFTKNVTTPTANPPTNYVNFQKKFNFSSTWFFQKLFYFSQKM